MKEVKRTTSLRCNLACLAEWHGKLPHNLSCDICFSQRQVHSNSFKNFFPSLKKCTHPYWEKELKSLKKTEISILRITWWAGWIKHKSYQVPHKYFWSIIKAKGSVCLQAHKKIISANLRQTGKYLNCHLSLGAYLSTLYTCTFNNQLEALKISDNMLSYPKETTPTLIRDIKRQIGFCGGLTLPGF